VKNSRNYTELLRKYVANNCTPAELDRVLTFLSTEKGELALRKILEQEAAISEQHPAIDPVISERIYNKLHKSRRQKDHQPANTQYRQVSYYNFAPKLAASFVGILLISVVLYLGFYRTDSIVYATQYGETKTLLLPDSSVVTLNANSKLRLVGNWANTQPREVWLEGEAFFSVQHTLNDQKFLVHTPKLQVEVLGTEFNVNNRRDKTTVVLSSGSVKLNAENLEHGLVMQPGDLVAFATNTNDFQQKIVDTELYTSWKNHRLVFDGTAIQDIAQILEDTYGLEVIIKDRELGQKKFKGTVPSHDLDILVQGLSESFNINVTRKGNTIFIKNKNPATAESSE